MLTRHVLLAEDEKKNQSQLGSAVRPALPAAAASVPDYTRHPLLHLQRTIGNQAVGRMMQSDQDPSAQAVLPRLAINAPGDEFEQEADRIAEQVAQRPAGAIAEGCPACGTGQPGAGSHRSEATGPGVTVPATAPALVHDVLRAQGQPLDPATRAFMEPRLGSDLRRVRVHTDPLAARSAEAVGAQAYTVGFHVIFAQGRYAPASRDGQRLLAHELAHVVQQNRSPTVQARLQRQPKPAPTPAGGKLSAADRAKMLARIKDVKLTIIRPKVTWKRVIIDGIELIQYGSIVGGDNFIGVAGEARVLPGAGDLKFGFVQACLPVVAHHVEYQDRRNGDVYQRDTTSAIKGLLPRLDADPGENPWYIVPESPDRAGRVNVVFSDNPTGGAVTFVPRVPTATISEACWAMTFVTAFAVQLPDGTRHPLRSFWWQLHFAATISPKGSDPLGNVNDQTAVSVTPDVDGVIDPALNLPAGGPSCTEAIHTPGKFEGPGKFHATCATVFKP